MAGTCGIPSGEAASLTQAVDWGSTALARYEPSGGMHEGKQKLPNHKDWAM